MSASPSASLSTPSEQFPAKDDSAPQAQPESSKPATQSVLPSASLSMPSAQLEALTVSVSVQTTPPGADVYVADFRNPGAGWERLGTSPLKDTRVSSGMLRWRVEKAGYETVESAFWSGVVTPRFTLHQTRPAGMVFVPGGPTPVGVAAPVALPDYWIDRYEISNRDFQHFVDAGGYATREYWKQQPRLAWFRAGFFLTARQFR